MQPTTLPPFNADGDLSPGVYRATLSKVLERFGQDSVQRRAVADRLSRIYLLTRSTGQLGRFVVFGSFVTAKIESNDVDIVIIMEDTFNVSSVSGEVALVFQHMQADAHFGASVFWTTRSGAFGGEQAMVNIGKPVARAANGVSSRLSRRHHDCERPRTANDVGPD